ncbi:MAG: nicotinamide-nucleotide amidohydrolase family protein [Leptospirales bacterium]|nr:nicotinamide-nucleotide amidohydrolase family protein [Leptospirales bacterium]
MRASIYVLSTGTELSSGRSIDSNAPHIARALAERGFNVAGLGTLPDDAGILYREIEHTLQRPEIDGIIMTGGLGPTEDDYTIDTLSALSKAETAEDPGALRKLELLARRYPNRIKLEHARRQARVLKGHAVLKNERGLAPGVRLTVNVGDQQRWIAAMPGVPQEMELILETELLPWLEERYPQTGILRRSFYVYGLGESTFQARFFGMGRNASTEAALFPRHLLPADFVWGVTAEAGRLKAFFQTADTALLKSFGAAAQQEWPDSYSPELAEHLLHRLARERGFSIATAESCTGGLASKLLTDLPGASAYMRGAIVAYHNEVKIHRLQVDPALLERKGAVSEECAIAMAQGACAALDADYSVAITGVAGPDGGSAEKPVGLVHLAAAGGKIAASCRVLQIGIDRDRIRHYSAHLAIYLLYRHILTDLGLPLPG